MSVKMISQVWSDNSIKSRAELLLLLALADFSNDLGECWPSVETLAFKARCTQRAVQKMVSRLISCGKLQVDQNAGPKGTNVYRLFMGGANPVHPEPSVSKKEPLGSPDPSGSVRNRQQAEDLFKASDEKPVPKLKSVPGGLEEVKSYGMTLEPKLPSVECEKFYDYFQSNGWKVGGRTPMKDWKAAVRNWHRNWHQRVPSLTPPTPGWKRRGELEKELSNLREVLKYPSNQTEERLYRLKAIKEELAALNGHQTTTA